jgi:hypothetical protein
MPRTGEHPAVTISEATPVRLGLVVTLVGAALALATAAGAAHYRLGAVEKEQDTGKVERATLESHQHGHALRLQAVEQNDAAQTRLLEKIDARMERWERRGDTRPARGGQ